jgi:hypothetical protein
MLVQKVGKRAVPIHYALKTAAEEVSGKLQSSIQLVLKNSAFGTPYLKSRWPQSRPRVVVKGKLPPFAGLSF